MMAKAILHWNRKEIIMNNQELELKVKEILANKNFFDMIEAAIAFEREYKTTDFFKKTKISLIEIIKSAKVWYSLQFNDIGERIQRFINELDFTQINNILDQFSDVFGQENEETLQIIKEFKSIVK
jgi:hypothetical protein